MSETWRQDEPLGHTVDPETLREVYLDHDALRSRIEQLRGDVVHAPDEIAELVVRGELVELLRGAGELDDAREEGQRAVDRAEMVGNAAQQHTARLRLAHVDQWRGDFVQANLSLTELMAASTQFGPVIEAFTHQSAGYNDYEQGHFDDARRHFARALKIREELELDEADSSRTALAAALRRSEAP